MQVTFVQIEAEYRPKEFQHVDWEVVQGGSAGSGFAPLHLEDLTQGSKFSHSPEGETVLVERRKEKKPKIDLEKIQAEKDQAFQDGFVAGVIEGRKQADLEVDEKLQVYARQVQEIVKSIKEQSEILFVKIEKEAVALALDISKKILLTTASVKPEYIFEVVKSALSAVGANQPLRIRMSPEDFEFLSVVGLPPELSNEETGVIYVADETIKSGCVVETNFGEVDLQLEKMWLEVKDRLFEVCK